MENNTRCLSQSWKDNTSDGAVIAFRSDGLGERLNALLNALYLSQKLDLKFGFTWESTLGNGSIHNMCAVNKMFSQNFIDAYFIEEKLDLSQYPELSGKNRSVSDLKDTLSQTNIRGFRGPRIDLNDILDKTCRPNNDFNLGDIFKQIDFHPDIMKTIEAAYQVELPENPAALHLRSGDVFYGEYRKWLHYTYKGITLPIAKALIEKLQKKKKSVILFGQDKEVLYYLKSTFNITLVKDLILPSFSSDIEADLFEIVLMSRCTPITAGSSGFAKMASWINHTKILAPADYFSHAKQTKYSLDDLAANAEKYNPLQSSFAYWYAYFYGRQFKKIGEIDRILKLAYKYDPENQLYAYTRAFSLFKHKKYIEGEKVLEGLIESEFRLTHDINLPCFKVLSAKTAGNYNLKEYLPHLDQAAIKGYPYAMVLLSEFKRLQKDNVCLHLLRYQAIKVSTGSLFFKALAKGK